MILMFAIVLADGSCRKRTAALSCCLDHGATYESLHHLQVIGTCELLIA